jgi:hypothetical protein
MCNNPAMTCLASIYAEQGMTTEARSIRATAGWETRRQTEEFRAKVKAWNETHPVDDLDWDEYQTIVLGPQR